MTRRARIWTWSAVAFVVFAAIVGRVVDVVVHWGVQRATQRFGYVPDPEGVERFLGELEQPTFREAGEDAVKQAKFLDVFLYRNTDKAHRAKYGSGWTSWDQGAAGTCVSFAFGLGCQTALATDWAIKKNGPPPTDVATEPIYGGARTAGMGQASNFGGDGATGYGAARWIGGRCKTPNIGGVLFRQPYPQADLSRYSIPLSRAWGRDGVPTELARAAYANRCFAVSQVTSWSELAASLESGYPVAVASQVGYGPIPRTRDKDGFLTRGTPWSHAMLIWAIRHQKNGSGRDGALIQNSWNTSWVRGPTWPDDQPAGSFWASRQDVEAALKQGDSWAISGSTFEYRPLKNADWMEGE